MLKSTDTSLAHLVVKGNDMYDSDTMVEIKRVPMFGERREVVNGPSERFRVGDRYEVIFDETEVEEMRNPDLELARCALFRVGMDIAPSVNLVRERYALLDAIGNACLAHDIDVHHIFAPGAILGGAEFGSRLLEGAKKSGGISLDSWLAKQQAVDNA